MAAREGPPGRLKTYTIFDGARVPFAELMALTQVDATTFESRSGAWGGGVTVEIGGEARPTSFGGHVAAQSVWAAAHTVPAGFIAHSSTGYFISRGLADQPFVYRVRTLRAGRNFHQRAVDVTQAAARDVVFSCLCSFKLPEPAPPSPNAFEIHPPPRDLLAAYRADTGEQHPRDVPDVADFSGASLANRADQYARTSNVPGLHVARVPMARHNRARHPTERRSLLCYAVQGAMPPPAAAPNLHAAAHIYASDHISIYTVRQHFGVYGHTRASGSLAQTTLFHGGADLLCTTPAAAAAQPDKWFYQEVETDFVGDGRGIHRSRLFDDAGRLIATTMQDGLVQLQFDGPDEPRDIIAAYPPPTPATYEDPASTDSASQEPPPSTTSAVLQFVNPKSKI